MKSTAHERSILASVKSAFQDPKLQLAAPLTLFIGLEQGFIYADFIEVSIAIFKPKYTLVRTSSASFNFDCVIVFVGIRSLCSWRCSHGNSKLSKLSVFASPSWRNPIDVVEAH